MPIYEYRCHHCDHAFDRLQPLGADCPPCPRCGGAAERILSRPAFRFKGHGFHATDYTRTGPKSR